MTIKTFRGLLADGAEDRIRLRTKDGSTGYRIVKLQIIRETPTASTDHMVKIFKVAQTSVPTSSATIDLSDNTLLAVSTLSGTAFGEYYTTIISDQEVFNQDIYVTHTDNDGSEGMNYYIELEQVPLSDNESAMAILKSLRSKYESYTPAGPS